MGVAVGETSELLLWVLEALKVGEGMAEALLLPDTLALLEKLPDWECEAEGEEECERLAEAVLVPDTEPENVALVSLAACSQRQAR